jgi:hypothetical protein
LRGWLRRFHHQLLGGLDAAEQRDLAGLVEVHADAEVDLVRLRVGGELFVEAEDGVARCELDRGEKRGHRVIRAGMEGALPQRFV